MEWLAAALGLPEIYRCVPATVATGVEALLIILRILAYPNRRCDLVPPLGRSESELSIIFKTVYTSKATFILCTLN